MIKIQRFTAEWCGPCKMMNPVFEELKNELPELQVELIDIDQNPDLAKSMGVKSIPTLVFYKNNMIVNKHVGACPKKFILDIINKIK